MSSSARLLVPDSHGGDHGLHGDPHAFLATIPTIVDGGARVVAAYRYCPADRVGPAAATVLVHWGEDEELPEWGTHVMSYEADLGRHLLWHARYFDDFAAAWVDLRDRMAEWRVVPREPRSCSPERVSCRSRRARR